jgi:MFS family permease
MKRPGPMLALFLTVLLDLLGFAMFIPDIQLRGEQVARTMYGANATNAEIGWFVGIMLAAYSVAQLLTSPQLGRLSDIKGRRPVLLFSSGLAVVGYLVYGHWVTPEGMILSRILTGIAAANLGVAFAYVADTTTPEDRAKSLGMLGAAFGIGFIFGPVLGSQLLKASNDSPALLSNVSAGLALLNIVFIYFWLPESIKPGAQATKLRPIQDLITALKTPGLGILIVMFFMVNLCFTNLETTYFRLLAEPNWIFKFKDPKDSGAIVLAMVGVVGVIVQGFLVRLAVKKYGISHLPPFVRAHSIHPFVVPWGACDHRLGTG